LSEKIKILFLLTAGGAATAYGMLGDNNFIFIAGIAAVVTGYFLIRKNLKISFTRQQNTDTPDIITPSDEE